MHLLLILLIIFLLVILAYHISCHTEYFSASCASQCAHSHSQNGENYVWLNPLGYGSVIKVEFEEPIFSGNWTLYDDSWWETHCNAVDHNPNNLVRSHVDAFINPNTRFAKLRFSFTDGSILEPTKQFYELEAAYFKKNNYCSN
jgi:hypothetical protein